MPFINSFPIQFPISAINPRTGKPFTKGASNAALIKATTERGLAQYQNVAMKRIVQVMAEQSTESVGAALTIFGESLRNKFSASRNTEVKNVHLKAAQSAQQAMLGRYGKIVKPRSVGSYRADAPGKWKRYSGGQLEKALASPNFYRASHDGILFGNMTHLDQLAPQWYRVNYGAGARGQGYRAQSAFPIDSTGLNLIPKSFSPSGSYMMPSGVFGDIGLLQRGVQEPRTPRVDITSIRGGRRRSGRQRLGSPLDFGAAGFSNGKPVDLRDRRGKVANFDATPFHPINYVLTQIPEYGGPVMNRRISKGFAGAFFIEAGMKRMGQVLPASYKGLMRRWLREAANTTPSGPIAKIVDTPTANTLLKTVELDIDKLTYRGNQRFLK